MFHFQHSKGLWRNLAETHARVQQACAPFSHRCEGRGRSRYFSVASAIRHRVKMREYPMIKMAARLVLIDCALSQYRLFAIARGNLNRRECTARTYLETMERNALNERHIILRDL